MVLLVREGEASRGLRVDLHIVIKMADGELEGRRTGRGSERPLRAVAASAPRTRVGDSGCDDDYKRGRGKGGARD